MGVRKIGYHKADWIKLTLRIRILFLALMNLHAL